MKMEFIQTKNSRKKFSMTIFWLTSLFLLAIIIATSFDGVDAGRRGGGGSFGRGSSRSRGSSSKGGGLFGSLFGGSKKKTSSNKNPQSSYPKQQYKPTNTGGNSGYGGGNKGVGGGGWAAPKPGNQGSGRNTGIGGGGFVAPGKNNVGGRNTYGYKGSQPTFSNSYGRYGGGTSVLGGSRSSGLFGGGGRGAFAMGAGAGFLGGAMAGVAMMETYHRYRLYRSMMYGGYGYGHGGMYGGYGSFYNRRPSCYGGCPIGAFCDFGMCRCQGGYEARYGSCFNNRDSFNGRSWNQRQASNFDPHVSCSGHKECLKIDMNSICATDNSKCECREDMKWNQEKLECQVYMDVDCSDLDSGKEEEEVESTSVKPEINDIENSGNGTDASLDIANVTLPNYNLTETDSGEFELNLTSLSPKETLKGSKLLEIDVNKTSKTEIRREFCREIKAVSLKYSEPQRVPNRYNNNYVPRRNRGWSFGTTAVIIALVLGCCACCCIVAFFKKAKEKFRSKRSNDWDGNSSSNGHTGDVQFPNPAYGDTNSPTIQPAYPLYPTPSESQPYNPNAPPAPPVPGMPAIPPTQPGYPAGPIYPPVAPPSMYPPAPGSAPYPPNPGSAPYPPNPGSAPYPPNPVVAPPYPADPNSFAAPPYPPAPGTNNPPPYSN